MTPEKLEALNRHVDSMTVEQKAARLREIGSMTTEARRLEVNTVFIRAVEAANCADDLLMEAFKARTVAYDKIDAMQHEHALLLETGLPPTEPWKVILTLKKGRQSFRQSFFHPVHGIFQGNLTAALAAARNPVPAEKMSSNTRKRKVM
jgi:hypothetical protein